MKSADIQYDVDYATGRNRWSPPSRIRVLEAPVYGGYNRGSRQYARVQHLTPEGEPVYVMDYKTRERTDELLTTVIPLRDITETWDEGYAEHQEKERRRKAAAELQKANNEYADRVKAQLTENGYTPYDVHAVRGARRPGDDHLVGRDVFAVKLSRDLLDKLIDFIGHGARLP